MSINPEDIKRKIEIDRLLSKANIHRMRSEYVEFEGTIREAISLDETRVDLQEYLGDALQARGQLNAAKAQFKKVLEMDPTRTSVETKYARAVLEMGEIEYSKRLTQEMFDNPRKYQAQHAKHPLKSFLLALLVPGLGQIVNLELVKGAIVMGSYFFSILMLALMPADTKNLLRSLFMVMYPGSMDGQPPPVSGLAAFFASVAVGIYIYGVVDAFIIASKDSKPASK